jgi:hypothetical protein
MLLSPELTPATASVTLGRSGVNSHLHGVFIGDAFLVALPYSGQENEFGMRIARVELDGSVASPPPAFFGNYINEARLAMTDGGPLLVFAEAATEEDPNGRTYSVFLDESGSLASTPVLVGPGIEPGALASFGMGALLAASARDTKPDVYNPVYADLVQLDAAGSPSLRLPIARHPGDVQSFQVVTRTDDAVVAWMSLDGPELGRVVP